MITKRQKQTLDFIKKHIVQHDYAPSLEEIKKHLGLSSVSTAHYHVEALQDLGYLRKEENQPRVLDVYSKQKLVHIPLLGRITAGQPIEQVENKENIVIPQSKIKSGNNYFALRVTGESMRDENISHDDIVIIKKQTDAENGQKVVALINNYEVTLKKIYKEKNKIRLELANPKFESLLVDPNHIKIQGIVVDVIKSQSKNLSLHTLSNEDLITEKTVREIETSQNRNTNKRSINQLNDLSASEWISETVSVYVQKGLGASHKDAQIEKQHPAPFSFQDVGRLIRFFTKEGQTVLDPFCGDASTLKAAALNNRNGVGIELVKKYCELGRKRLETEVEYSLFNKSKQTIINGDAFEEIENFPENASALFTDSLPLSTALGFFFPAKAYRYSSNLFCAIS